MGIHVSYTGSDGRRRAEDIDGLPTAGSELDRLIRGTPIMQAVPGSTKTRRRLTALAEQEESEADKGKVKSSEVDDLAFLGEKVLASGSIKMTGRGKLCLKGEESETRFEDARFYSSKGGERKFRTMKDMDSVESPRDIGGASLSASTEPDGTSKDLNAEYAIRFSVCTRHAFEMVRTDEDSPLMCCIYEFTREARFSAMGRLVGLGPERRRVLCTFQPGTNGGGEGLFGARAFWKSSSDNPDKMADKPHLVSIAFGSDDMLSTWDEESQKFTCNYDEEGQLLEDPPVKIVDTDVCRYASEEE